MEDWLSVHEHAYGKVYFLYSLVFVVNIIALIFLTVNYCLSKYSLEYFKEDDPDIDLTGLKGFSFSQISHDEYSPTMSNLGPLENFSLIVIKVHVHMKNLIDAKKQNVLEKVKIENAIHIMIHVMIMILKQNMDAQLVVE